MRPCPNKHVLIPICYIHFHNVLPSPFLFETQVLWSPLVSHYVKFLLLKGMENLNSYISGMKETYNKNQ